MSVSVYFFVFFLILVNGKLMPQTLSDLDLPGVWSHLRFSGDRASVRVCRFVSITALVIRSMPVSLLGCRGPYACVLTKSPPCFLCPSRFQISRLCPLDHLHCNSGERAALFDAERGRQGGEDLIRGVPELHEESSGSRLSTRAKSSETRAKSSETVANHREPQRTTANHSEHERTI